MNLPELTTYHTVNEQHEFQCALLRYIHDIVSQCKDLNAKDHNPGKNIFFASSSSSAALSRQKYQQS